MFYSYELFGRKTSELGRAWLAGTVGLRKTTRAILIHYNMKSACMAVQNPRVPLALPTQGTLLLGLARIEAKQVEYLHGDAFEAKTHASSVSAASAVQAASALELAQPSARLETITMPTKPGDADILMAGLAMDLANPDYRDLDHALAMAEAFPLGDMVGYGSEDVLGSHLANLPSQTQRHLDVSHVPGATTAASRLSLGFPQWMDTEIHMARDSTLDEIGPSEMFREIPTPPVPGAEGEAGAGLEWYPDQEPDRLDVGYGEEEEEIRRRTMSMMGKRRRGEEGEEEIEEEKRRMEEEEQARREGRFDAEGAVHAIQRAGAGAAAAAEGESKELAVAQRRRRRAAALYLTEEVDEATELSTAQMAPLLTDPSPLMLRRRSTLSLKRARILPHGVPSKEEAEYAGRLVSVTPGVLPVNGGSHMQYLCPSLRYASAESFAYLTRTPYEVPETAITGAAAGAGAGEPGALARAKARGEGEGEGEGVEEARVGAGEEEMMQGEYGGMEGAGYDQYELPMGVGDLEGFAGAGAGAGERVGTPTELSTSGLYAGVERGRGVAGPRHSILDPSLYFEGSQLPPTSASFDAARRESMEASMSLDISGIEKVSMSQIHAPTREDDSLPIETVRPPGVGVGVVGGPRAKLSASQQQLQQQQFIPSDQWDRTRVPTLAEMGPESQGLYGMINQSLLRAAPKVSRLEGREVDPSEVQVSFVDAMQEAALRLRKRELRRAAAAAAGAGAVSESEAESEGEVPEARMMQLRRSDVAKSFAQLLALRSSNIIDTQQDVPYGPLYVSQGVNWSAAAAPAPGTRRSSAGVGRKSSGRSHA